jgi:hypothetical protein
MAERKDTDSLLMDWLYEPAEEQERAEQEVSAHQGELDSFRRVREAFRELPEEEPPPALTAILMHEAAKRAPARPARAATVEHDEERGFFAWLGRIFGTMMAHPAATAAATLLIVAGVAGSLYVRGHTANEAQIDSAAPEPGLVAELDRAEAPAETATGESRAAAAAEPTDEDLRLPYDNSYTITLADGELEEARNRDADKPTEKLELAKKQDTSASTRSAPQKKSPSKDFDEVQANVISGADRLISADDEDAVTSVQKPGRGANARDQKPTGGAPASPPPAQWQGNVGGDSAGAESAPPADGWAQDKHVQLVDEARRDQCAAAARTANDIRERAPAYYDDHVAGSEAYKRCSSTIVAERKRRAARSKEAAAESADQPAAADRPAADPPSQ